MPNAEIMGSPHNQHFQLDYTLTHPRYLKTLPSILNYKKTKNKPNQNVNCIRKCRWLIPHAL